jgi:hypothetical protein
MMSGSCHDSRDQGFLRSFVVADEVDDCVAVPLADWSPVVVVDVVSADWAPVDVVASTDDDWLPVVVLLSIVRLERPRRSMVGLNVEVEPVTDEFTSVDEPATLLLVVDVEPETDGLAVAVPEALLSVRVPVEAVVPVPAAPVVAAPVVAAPVTDDAPACESGMQSMWTALADFSFALPVALPASLPACGWPSSLQSGFELVVVAVVLCARAGAAPMSAATAIALMYLERIMVCLLEGRKKKSAY